MKEAVLIKRHLWKEINPFTSCTHLSSPPSLPRSLALVCVSLSLTLSLSSSLSSQVSLSSLNIYATAPPASFRSAINQEQVNTLLTAGERGVRFSCAGRAGTQRGLLQQELLNSLLGCYSKQRPAIRSASANTLHLKSPETNFALVPKTSVFFVFRPHSTLTWIKRFAVKPAQMWTELKDGSQKLWK